jgi:hypothetical protein
MPGGFPGPGAGGPRGQRQFGDWQLENPDNRDAVRVWAHDITAEPGATYRYRMVVALVNPLFQRQAVPPEQRQQHFNKIALGPDLQATGQGWTDPVAIDEDRHFFMVEGRAQQNQATLDVWRLQGGEWHNRQFTAQAGDPIGGVIEVEQAVEGEPGEGGARGPNGQGEDGQNEQLQTQQVDMRIGAILVDVTESSGQGMVGSVTRMLYRPTQRPRLLSRTLSEDQEHPKLIELRNQTADLQGDLRTMELAIEEGRQAIQEREQRQQQREQGGQTRF